MSQMTSEKQSTKGESMDAGPIRVLIVDDVKSARDLLKDILATDRRFEVVGEVADGLEAVDRALELRPGLITMDIRLPSLDGFLAVERILAEFPVPIVMITASLGDQKDKLFRAFKAGALDVLEKQELYLWRTRPEIRTGFVRKLLALAHTRVGSRVDSARTEVEAFLDFSQQDQRAPAESPQVVAIAASTGGPSTLMRLFQQIPARVNACLLVVQHMSRGFLEGLVQWLDNEVELSVREAKDGDPLEPGVVLFAPEDYHMLVSERGSIRLNKSLPISGHRPSAELLFESVARSFGRRAIGIILTGMGSDGAMGLKRLRERGGRTIAQDEQTSIIFGMPRAAIELDAAELVLPLEEIAPRMMAWISPRRVQENSNL
jgi:two-component system chemotaxis response regulator CheB